MDTRRPAQLRPHPSNPRGPVSDSDPGIAELAASIREVGLLQPIAITPENVVIAGHRRLVAAHLAGVQTVPVIVRNVTPFEQLGLMMIENLQREAIENFARERGYFRTVRMGQAIIEERAAIYLTDGSVLILFWTAVDLPERKTGGLGTEQIERVASTGFIEKGHLEHAELVEALEPPTWDPETPTGERECRDCRGSGVVDCECVTCGHEHLSTCAKCDGDGMLSKDYRESEERPERLFEICGETFNGNLIAQALATVLAPREPLIVSATKNGYTLRLDAPDWRIVVASLRYSRAKHGIDVRPRTAA